MPVLNRRLRRLLLPLCAAGALLAPTSAQATPLVANPPASISGTPAVGQQLDCDGSFDNFDYQADGRWNTWYRNGVAIPNYTEVWPGNVSRMVSVLDAGTDLTCENRATNMDGTVTSVSAPVHIPDVTPVIDTGFTMITGGTGTIGDVLTCNHATWAGGHVTVTHEWKRDGATVASGGTYAVTTADASHTLMCTETATNVAGSATSDSQSFGVSDIPAEVVTNPQVTGTAKVGQTLSCDGATFSGTNLTAPTYRWSREGDTIGTAQTYTLVADDGDRSVRCHVGVSNGSSNVEADSDYIDVVSGIPVNVTEPKLTGKGYPGLLLSCSPGTWTGDDITYTYRWTRDEQLIAGATKPKLLLTDADVDKVFVCRVTATNAAGSDSLDTEGIVGFAPGIKAPLAKTQPAVPRLGIALAKGVTAKLTCNVSCATSSHAYILMPLAKKLGLAPKNAKGGEFAIGVGAAHRTYAGELVVTTTFSAKVRKALATQKSVHLNMLYETSYGTVYNYRKYHVASFNSITLRR